MNLRALQGRWRRGSTGLILVLLLGWMNPGSAQENGVPWQGYEEAFQAAKEKGRPIFLYFFVDECSYCQRMDAQTFTSRRVVEYLKDTFISARIRGEEAPHIVRKYMVRGFPTSWFLNSDGRAITYMPGYLGPDEFAKVLRYIGGGHYKSRTLLDYLRGS